jgi:VCBS repeat-containing protein
MTQPNIQVIAIPVKGKATEIFEFKQAAASPAHATRIQTQPGVKYLVKDLAIEGQKAPQWVKVKRVGKHLEITFQSDTEGPDLVLENYYDVVTDDSTSLVGEAQNGSVYEYVAANANVDTPLTSITQTQGSVQAVLGKVQVAESSGAALGVVGINPLLAALGGVSAAGVGIAVQDAQDKAAAAAALKKLQNAAQTNSASASSTSLETYAAAGVTGITKDNVDAINSALNSAAISGTSIDTTAKVQAIVDAYNKILAEAKDPSAPNPKAADFAAIGVTGIKDGVQTTLLVDVLHSQGNAQTSSVEELNKLAAAVNAVTSATAATGSGTSTASTSKPSKTDLNTLGLSNVTDANLATVQNAIAQASAKQPLSSMSDLKKVVDSAVAASAASAATDAVTAATDAAAKATAATAALGAAQGKLSNPPTPAELQAVTDAQAAATAAAAAAKEAADAAKAAVDAAKAATAAAGETPSAALNTAESAATAAQAAAAAAVTDAAKAVDTAETATDKAVGTAVGKATDAVTAATDAAANATAATAALGAAQGKLSAPPTPAELQAVTDAQAAATAAAAAAKEAADAAKAAVDAAKAATAAAGETPSAALNTAESAATAAQAAAAAGVTDAAKAVDVAESATDAAVDTAVGKATDAVNAATDATAKATAATAAVGEAQAKLSTPPTPAELQAVTEAQATATKAAEDAAKAATDAQAAVDAAKVATAAAGETPSTALNAAESAAAKGVTDAAKGVTDAAAAVATAESATDAKVDALATAATTAANAATAATTAATAAQTALEGAVAAMSSPATPEQLVEVEAKQAAAQAAAATAAEKATAATAAATAAQAAAAAANEGEPASVAAANAAATAASAAATAANTAATTSESATDAKVASLVTTANNANTSLATAQGIFNSAQTALTSALSAMSDPATATELAAIETAKANLQTASTDLAAAKASAQTAVDNAQSAATAANETIDLSAVTTAITAANTATATTSKTLALATIEAAAQGNTATGSSPSVADYAAAGITVDATRLSSMNDALNDADVKAVNVNSTGNIQTLVSGYSTVFMAADGTAGNAGATAPVFSDYTAIGVNYITNAASASLLSDWVDGKTDTDVNTIAKLQAKADDIKVIMDVAAITSNTNDNTTQLSYDPLTSFTTALANLGISGVNANNVGAVWEAVRDTNNNGSGVNSLIKLQDIVNAANDRPVVVAGATATIAITTDEDISTTFVIGSKLTGLVSDPDEFAFVKGISVHTVHTTASEGTWSYSSDNGLNWTDFPTSLNATANFNNALYLNSTDQLRFTPSLNYNGPVGSIEFRAVDNSFADMASGTIVNIGLEGRSGRSMSSGDLLFAPFVTAVNDAAQFGGDKTGARTEDATTNTTSGILTVTDVESAEAGFLTPDSLTGTYGTYTFNTANGQWTYALDNTKASVQALATGQQQIDTLVVKSLDGTIQNVEVTITGVNDAPVLTTGSTLVYTENQAAQAINSSIIVSDIDTATMTSATVKITGGYVAAQDTLGFTSDSGSMGNITGTLSGDTMTLTSVGGTATKAQWQTALRAVTYVNSSTGNINPNTADRTVSYEINDGSDKSATLTSTITVKAVNHGASVIASAIDPINTQEDTAITFVIADKLAGKVTDVDGTPLKAIGIELNSSTSGSWSYSTDGSNWNALPSYIPTSTPSVTNVLYLNVTSSLRYTPGQDQNGTDIGKLQFRVIDDSFNGYLPVTNGGQTNINNSIGGTLSVSSTLGYFNVSVTAVNDAPVINSSTVIDMPSKSVTTSVPVDGDTTAGTLVSTLLGGFSDVDANPAKGIAVVTVHNGNSNNKFHYSIDGGLNWQFVGPTDVSVNNALLLDGNSRVFFETPNIGYNNNAIWYRGWDQTNLSSTIQAGAFTAVGFSNTADVNGGSTAYSATLGKMGLTTTTANSAPVLTTGSSIIYAFPTTPQSGSAPTSTSGMLVSTLINNNISDVNGSDGKGIAVTFVDTSRGSLWYSLDGGTNWTKVTATISGSNALLLGSDTNNRVFFEPTPGSTNSLTMQAAITFRAWDRTNGTEGSYANTSTNGGTSAFSTGEAWVSQAVSPVVIDLNRDGVLSYSQVAMDVDGDGHLDQTAWAGAKDGVLVWDKLGDGKVHDNSQYAFSQYGADGSTDLQGLAAGFDTNHDGVFNAKDAKFAEFKVWQDANQNGVVDAGEMHSLADEGIASINLSSDGVQRNPAEGVIEAGRSTATATDGSSVLVSDAGFFYSALAYSAQTVTGLGAHIDLLGANMNLDLSSLVAMHQNLAEINLSGTGANTLKLSLNDVLSTAAVNGLHKLTLTGDANDTVVMDTDNWTKTGETVTDGNHTYAVYTDHSTAQLLIAQAMLLQASHVI